MLDGPDHTAMKEFATQVVSTEFATMVSANVIQAGLVLHVIQRYATQLVSTVHA